MKVIKEKVDLLIAGGGTAGHIAAIQAGRAGLTVSVIESGSMLGGTMTEGGVFMPNHFHSLSGPVVQGIPWELYTKSRDVEGIPTKPFNKRRPVDTPGYYSHINIPIYASIAEKEAIKSGVILHYGEFVGEVRSSGNTWEIISYARGIKRITTSRELIDASGDADAVRALGLPVEKSPARQPGTLQYRISGIDLQQVWKGEVQKIYEEALNKGQLKKGDWAYFETYPFLWYLQMGGHNASHIYGCDTSDADGQTAANIAGREVMMRMFEFVKNEIPGAERAELQCMYARALSREGYRIVGEHRIVLEEFMAASSYSDQVCNAFNYIDLHNEEDGCKEIFLEKEDQIPKIPLSALIPAGSQRILAIGRILSADRESLAGLRAQCSCMAMGQAAGAAAALAVEKGIPSRDVSPRDIVALTVEHGAVAV